MWCAGALPHAHVVRHRIRHVFAPLVVPESLDLATSLVFRPSHEELESGKRFCLGTKQIDAAQPGGIVYEDYPVPVAINRRSSNRTMKVRMDKFQGEFAAGDGGGERVTSLLAVETGGAGRRGRGEGGEGDTGEHLTSLESLEPAKRDMAKSMMENVV